MFVKKTVAFSDVQQHGAPVERGRSRRPKNILGGVVLSAVRLSGSPVEMSLVGGEVNAGAVENLLRGGLVSRAPQFACRRPCRPIVVHRRDESFDERSVEDNVRVEHEDVIGIGRGDQTIVCGAKADVFC